MPEQQHLSSPLRGNQCNMTDVIQRISLSKPPVSMNMYKTLYMTDYKPFSEYQNELSMPTMDLAQKLKLEAQLKTKEFAKPTENEPMKYAEGPSCQEVQPPYPSSVEGRLLKCQEAPPSFQEIQDDQQKYVNAMIPNTERDLPYPNPAVIQEKEAEKSAQQTDPCLPAMPGNLDAPCIINDLGQNWANYQQFILENRRASNAQVQEIKKLSLESSAFPADYITSTEPSTYQRDYVHWPRVQSGFCRAHRNYSNLILNDGYYNKDPWMSEYMDNYSIFLRHLNWKSRNAMTSLCSGIHHHSHVVPSQTSIAVNTAL
ncbi:uncharacterized protein LOC128330736 [Hemicordylus capensis]|uniref:uncharacterized protein LOC128330736 n=1 Tax=Hemicordylus capensis TaxID=884348 RepID=UPI002304BCA3|nr:uncharacterized protein LOC128330736 [Hemicordylus capensis]